MLFTSQVIRPRVDVIDFVLEGRSKKMTNEDKEIFKMQFFLWRNTWMTLCSELQTFVLS